MMNARMTQRRLTDGSAVYQARFEAKHGDGTVVTVTLETYAHHDAVKLVAVLNETVAYAETDVRS